MSLRMSALCSICLPSDRKYSSPRGEQNDVDFHQITLDNCFVRRQERANNGKQNKTWWIKLKTLSFKYMANLFITPPPCAERIISLSLTTNCTVPLSHCNLTRHSSDFLHLSVKLSFLLRVYEISAFRDRLICCTGPTAFHRLSAPAQDPLVCSSTRQCWLQLWVSCTVVPSAMLWLYSEFGADCDCPDSTRLNQLLPT